MHPLARVPGINSARDLFPTVSRAISLFGLAYDDPDDEKSLSVAIDKMQQAPFGRELG